MAVQNQSIASSRRAIPSKDGTKLWSLNDWHAPETVYVDVYHGGIAHSVSVWSRPPELDTGMYSIAFWGGDAKSCDEAERRLMQLGYTKVGGGV